MRRNERLAQYDAVDYYPSLLHAVGGNLFRKMSFIRRYPIVLKNPGRTSVPRVRALKRLIDFLSQSSIDKNTSNTQGVPIHSLLPTLLSRSEPNPTKQGLSVNWVELGRLSARDVTVFDIQHNDALCANSFIGHLGTTRTNFELIVRR